ncbi:MAG TPA: IPExxxVDY family protein [Tenuifilaceae bacterium]|nr:IPExxxVDY family protein [Tenuifilaceae bacterium]
MSAKKIKLVVPPPQFTLIAISCFETLHKFVWLVNSHLSLQLSESDALKMTSANVGRKEVEGLIEFPLFRDEVSNPEIIFLVVKNRIDRQSLFKELHNIDYLFIIKGLHKGFDSDDICQRLKTIPSVMAAIPVDPTKLGSLNHILNS